MKRAVLALVLLPALSPLARAAELHVAGATPGFTEIRDAVAAAQPGDVIRVWPHPLGGNYLGDSAPGVRVYYQFWYRDNSGPCSTGANFSGGASLYWRP